MSRLFFILFCLIFTSTALGATVTATTVLNYAESNGGRAALEKYFSCDYVGFDGYAQVAKGSKQWLGVAVRLLDDSDACYSEGLNDAIARALLLSPRLVLPLVDSKSTLSAAHICLPFMSAEEPRKKHLAYLNKLEKRLSSVNDGPSQPGKKRCLDEIRSLRKSL